MVFVGLEKFDKMVLITQKEIREGSTAPLGTISFCYDGGEPHSVLPGDATYRYYQAVYADWKKRQADLARIERDRIAIAAIVAERGEDPPKKQRHILPGTPPVLANMDDLSLPLQQYYQADAVEVDVVAYVTLEPGYYRRYGCYSLSARFDKVKSSGTMGRRQTERARVLQDRLVAFVKEQLLASGWRIVPDEESERWRWEGPTIVETEQRLAQLARSTWRGHGKWQGNEKVVALPEDLHLEAVRSGVFHQVPGNETIEYLIEEGSGLLRVRRRRRLPTVEEQQRAPSMQVLDVIGDEEARERGADPAYQRTIRTREITFTCQSCKQTVTQHRLPGPKPCYCSDTCQDEARRQKTLERVRRLREERRKSKQPAETMVP